VLDDSETSVDENAGYGKYALVVSIIIKQDSFQTTNIKRHIK
jgi:hypothetical protein